MSKLIDQYYDSQEKLRHLNSTKRDYINLLRTKARSEAARAISEARLVQNGILVQFVLKGIDEATWLSLAQINYAENNLSDSEFAWTAALENTKDLSVYMFSKQGLMANQISQKNNKDAEETLNSAIKTVFDEMFKGVANPYQAYIRNIQAASTDALWLSKTQTKDCASFSSHYDEALKFVAEAYRTANPTDLGYQDALLLIRSTLHSFRKTRASCAPNANAELLAADDCYAIAGIVDNAPLRFEVYRGDPVTPDEPNSDVRSRFDLPEVEGCFVDSGSTFYCRWPERDETETKIRANKIVEKLLACKNLTQVNKVSFTENAEIKIIRTHWKPTDRRSEHWVLTLEVSPQTS